MNLPAVIRPLVCLILLPAALGGCLATSTPRPVSAPSFDLSAPAPARDTAKVALLIPLSGKDAGLGESMQNAASLAVSDLGDPYFEVVFSDTQSTPDGASGAAAVAVADGARLILGPIFADEARAVQSAVQTVPILPFSTDTTVARQGTFIMGVLPQDQARHIAHFAAARDAKNTLIIAPSDAYGQIMVHTFSLAARQLGRTVTGPIWVDPKAPDIGPQLATIFTSGAGRTVDSVFVPMVPAKAQAALQTLYAMMTTKPSLVLGTGLWEGADTVTYPLLKGGFYADSSPAARERFESRYQAQFGIKPHRLASLAYDATALAITINRTMGAGGYTPQTLAHPNGFSGMNGLFRFTQDGIIERSLAIIQIGEMGPVTAIPAAQAFR